MKMFFPFLIFTCLMFSCADFLMADTLSQEGREKGIKAAEDALKDDISGVTDTLTVPLSEKASPDIEVISGNGGAETPVSAVSASSSEKHQNSVENGIKEKTEKITVLELIGKGGPLMWVIGLMSLLVVGFALERFIYLRRIFVVPSGLIREVNALIAHNAPPTEIYGVCKRYHSAASNVMKEMLRKTGRPVMEVDMIQQEAKSREATRLYGNVQFLVMASAVTPLIGLLGTVIGMIQAFFATATMNAHSAVGVNKAELLSQGIYTALVTTCAGLVVAIPAAILAHWYELRIISLFRMMDRQLLRFTAYLESLEGKYSVDITKFED